MTIRSGSALLLCGLSAAFVGVERHRHVKPPAPYPPHPAVVIVAAAAEPTVCMYTDAASGIRFGYPSTWVPEKAKTAVLAVEAPARVGCASLCLDVPPMPLKLRLPMIPMGLVTSHYVEDLRKGQIPDAQVQESVDVSVPGASARRIVARGHENGRVRIDDAVFLVRRGQVYILSTDSDDKGAAAARAALDSAVASVQWAK